MSKRLSEWGKTSVILAVSLYFSLALADAGLQAVQDGPRQMAGLYQPDAVRGYSMVPNFKGTVRTTQDFDVATNDQGYRDLPWNPSPGLRVAVAGDSFTFGEPLQIEQGFVRKAQSALPGSFFYNLGVSGYGVPQVLATIRQECPIIRPRHVFYMYYLNDTNWDEMAPNARTVVDGYIVQAVGEDRQTRLTQQDLHRRVQTALARYDWSITATLGLEHLGALLESRGLLPKQLMAGWKSQASNVETGDLADYTPQASQLARQMILEMQKAAQSCGASFTMVVLPSANEIANKVEEPATQRLLRLLDGGGIDILDLRTSAPAGESINLQQDRHYNDKGTSWVAKQLVDHLRSRYAL